MGGIKKLTNRSLTLTSTSGGIAFVTDSQAEQSTDSIEEAWLRYSLSKGFTGTMTKNHHQVQQTLENLPKTASSGDISTTRPLMM